MSTGPDDVPASGFVLILGGTAEARALALAATSARVPVVSSLAGRVSNPALPVGPVRIGGFGGVAGLVDYLTAHRVTAVVDATHPFAATISASAVNACGAAGFPLLRLARPGWSGRQDASTWHWVDSVEAAGLLAMELGHRAFLTTGRQTLAAYGPMTGRYALVRVVEPPTEPLSACWELITDRGPYRLDRELSLLREHRIDVLVTKDFGRVVHGGETRRGGDSRRAGRGDRATAIERGEHCRQRRGRDRLAHADLNGDRTAAPRSPRLR